MGVHHAHGSNERSGLRLRGRRNGTLHPGFLRERTPMVELSTVDRAKRMCAQLAQFTLPEPKRKSTLFTVRLGHRKWTVSNFSELPLCVRILTRHQRKQIVDRELQQTTPRIIFFF